LYVQYKSTKFLELPSFDKAVDEFFSKLETQKIDVQRKQQEDAVLKKIRQS